MIIDKPFYDAAGPFPPLHPMHFKCIQTSPGHRHGLAAVYDVDYPIEMTQDDEAEAVALLDAWAASKLPLAHEHVQEWILATLGYYKGAYADRRRSEPACWRDDWLLQLPRLNPMRHIADHAGVRHIHRFYGAWPVSERAFAEAAWNVRVSVRMNELRGVALCTPR